MKEQLVTVRDCHRAWGKGPRKCPFRSYWKIGRGGTCSHRDAPKEGDANFIRPGETPPKWCPLKVEAIRTLVKLAES